jgi:hypothetical protein
MPDRQNSTPDARRARRRKHSRRIALTDFISRGLARETTSSNARSLVPH